MTKRVVILLLTGASLFCTMAQLLRLRNSDEDWLPMERGFLIVTSCIVFVTTLLLWARVRRVVTFTVAALIVFGLYQGALIYSTVWSENYSGITVFFFLLLMALCPFVAAGLSVLWRKEFCDRTCHVAKGVSAYER